MQYRQDKELDDINKEYKEVAVRSNNGNRRIELSDSNNKWLRKSDLFKLSVQIQVWIFQVKSYMEVTTTHCTLEQTGSHPVEAFWSLTTNDEDGVLVENTINRYAIGDRDVLEYNHDGALKILI